MHALDKRNLFKTSKYYIKVCNLFIVSLQVFVVITLELFTKQRRDESDI